MVGRSETAVGLGCAGLVLGCARRALECAVSIVRRVLTVRADGLALRIERDDGIHHG